ncbi:helix-turn-helix transcriptional regulator [Rhodovulum sulfidophilum]|nr:helix-turn-helix transcriptional regulator [Rhodovulum sulfidophilum]MCE8456301.1 helix-turn-helix transcriptional regulator [Rhodovulum sulfidophilum]
MAAWTGERADMSDMVTIPRDEYERLREAAEDLEDILAYDRAKADLAAGRDELVPAEFADRIIDGESPVRVYRDLRGLTQAALAEKAGINRVIVAEMETGRKQGSAQTLKKIADALGVTVDDLI